jgi:hypothetical protein
MIAKATKVNVIPTTTARIISYLTNVRNELNYGWRWLWPSVEMEIRVMVAYSAAPPGGV